MIRLSSETRLKKTSSAPHGGMLDVFTVRTCFVRHVIHPVTGNTSPQNDKARLSFTLSAKSALVKDIPPGSGTDENGGRL